MEGSSAGDPQAGGRGGRPCGRWVCPRPQSDLLGPGFFRPGFFRPGFYRPGCFRPWFFLGLVRVLFSTGRGRKSGPVEDFWGPRLLKLCVRTGHAWAPHRRAARRRCRQEDLTCLGRSWRVLRTLVNNGGRAGKRRSGWAGLEIRERGQNRVGARWNIGRRDDLLAIRSRGRPSDESDLGARKRSSNRDSSATKLRRSTKSDCCRPAG